MVQIAYENKNNVDFYDKPTWHYSLEFYNVRTSPVNIIFIYSHSIFSIASLYLAIESPLRMKKDNGSAMTFDRSYQEFSK